MVRRRLLAAGLLAPALPVLAAEPPRDVTLEQDFDELWRTLGERYAYMADKATDWDEVRALYRPQAAAAGSIEAFARVLAGVLAELYDAHTHLADPPEGIPRYPPFDLVVEPAGPIVRIISVRVGSSAASAGLAVGDYVTHVDGVPVLSAAARLLPRCLGHADPSIDAYVFNAAVAGRRGRPRRLTIGGRGDVDLPLRNRPDASALSWRRLPDGSALIRIESFADDATVGSFDEALAALRDSRGLLIDVRDNGGGDTAVARPIMGRFIRQARAYARMRRREGRGLGRFWTEVVEPRGPFTYERPVVVLCDRWSGSMAEGFPMGMRATCGARIVGQPMMGLGAAVFRLRLDRTGIEAQYSAEPVYDVEGRPRSALKPDVLVPDGGDVLAAGIAELRRLVT